jgi:hypothetical protein
MTRPADNGKIATIGQRLDPARVRQLEQQSAFQSQLLVNRALGELSNLANALQFLKDQADAGHPQSRQVLQLLFSNLDAARAASAGIVVPDGAAPRRT